MTRVQIQNLLLRRGFIIFIKVKNKRGTSEKDAASGYSSWLDFWEKKKYEIAGECKVFACTNRAELGAHVIKSGQGGKEYILPMCSSCNNKDGKIFNTLKSFLVSVK